jgi:hypothetical protein
MRIPKGFVFVLFTFCSRNWCRKFVQGASGGLVPFVGLYGPMIGVWRRCSIVKLCRGTIIPHQGIHLGELLLMKPQDIFPHVFHCYSHGFITRTNAPADFVIMGKLVENNVVRVLKQRRKGRVGIIRQVELFGVAIELV